MPSSGQALTDQAFIVALSTLSSYFVLSTVIRNGVGLVCLAWKVWFGRFVLIGLNR